MIILIVFLLIVAIISFASAISASHDFEPEEVRIESKFVYHSEWNTHVPPPFITLQILFTNDKTTTGWYDPGIWILGGKGEFVEEINGLEYNLKNIKGWKYL